MNLNVHLHVLATDGVFVDTVGDRPDFRPLPAASRGEIAAVAWEVCERVVALLKKRGQCLDAPPETDALAETEPLLAQLYAASIAGTLVMGPYAGCRLTTASDWPGLCGVAMVEATRIDKNTGAVGTRSGGATSRATRP